MIGQACTTSVMMVVMGFEEHEWFVWCWPITRIFCSNVREGVVMFTSYFMGFYMVA